MIFLLVCAFIGVILFEVPSLIRNKHWRELIVFSIFLSMAFLMSLLPAIGVKLPSPAKGIDYLIEDILHLNYQ
ncbi:hypothetical protein [Desulfosporosinus youngiae]|uniref:Uncharacterized protein n=1 Tax=Desulfosporosinus youngiae DSM 17734 TaxID=768710 RepID=H5Y2W3_9FIRM|nr:hypothetical protein [Desulfosporosinus youngiae]EHQ88520.1 hypothetical protein DesyoDRAFT_1362 [Desulfosporosinus youngiae DSM 17734]